MAETRKIRVAIIQERDYGDVVANWQAIEQHLQNAQQQAVDLVLLQELHNGSYFCQHQAIAEFDRAETIPGPSTVQLAKWSKQFQLVIVGSLFEKRGVGLYHNTAVVFDKDGQFCGRYRKMHIPDDPGFMEKFYFTPGDLGFNPIETSIGKLGVLVCWDQWYPEAARLMALAGADLLLYPTAIGWDLLDTKDEQERQRDAWMVVQRGHAVANGMPVIVANRIGFEAHPVNANQGIQFWGNSFMTGPQGELLAHADAETAQLLVQDIDLARSESVRRIWPFLRDRRIDAYHDLLKRFRDN